VAAALMAAWGLVFVANVDNVIRPIVFRRWAKIHPLVTLIGAFAGIRYFGLLGLLVGPLALSYFFALIAMYKEEYIHRRRSLISAPDDRRQSSGRRIGTDAAT
jgi:predicted PurR-regulated permease PerM